MLYLIECPIFYVSLRLLTSNRPLQLGGVDPSSSWNYPSAVPSTSTFSCCIRNLIQDGKLYDMEVTYNSVGSESGCTSTDGNCVDSGGEALCVNGTCVASTDSAYCVCNPGWTGARCNQGEKRVQQTFYEKYFPLHNCIKLQLISMNFKLVNKNISFLTKQMYQMCTILLKPVM